MELAIPFRRSNPFDHFVPLGGYTKMLTCHEKFPHITRHFNYHLLEYVTGERNIIEDLEIQGSPLFREQF